MTINTTRAQILNDHNQYRARHRAQALRIDDALNISAQSYADKLAWQDGGIPHSGCQYGENLYSCSGMSPTNATREWYNEVSNYNYNGGGFSLATGHFTQLVWRSTSSLGVGIAQSSSGRYFVVAHYFTPGNAAGHFRDNVLPPQNNGAAPVVNPPSQPSVKSAQSLSAAIAGQRSLKSFDSHFLRAWRGPLGDREWYVDKAEHCKECEHWHIEDHGGKVVLKAYCWEGKYLRAHPNGTVDLADRPQAWEMWTPVRNGDGTWSFQSHFGSWLSAHRSDGIVCAMPHNKRCERFTLTSW